MKNKKTIIISLIVLIVITIVITISYAYFNASINTTNNVSFNHTFEDAQSYLKSYNAAGNNVTVSFEIKPEDMYYKGQDVTFSDNQTLTVELDNQTESDMYCTYDYVWEWESGTYTKTTGATNEFTVQVGTFNETQVSNYTTKLTTLGNGMLIAQAGKTVTTDVGVVTKFYNLQNVDQESQKNKSFTGSVKVGNVVCTDTTIASLNSAIAATTNQTSSQDSTTWEIVSEGGGLRYEGKDPDNYVCFKASCTDDELYRIIGTFTELVDTDNDGVADTNQSLIKIIKDTTIGGNHWNNGQNNWANSSLKNYLNNTWTKPTEDMLTTRWYTSAGSDNDLEESTAADWLTIERSGTIPGTGWPTYVDAKVGLMYPSDFGFGVLASDCAHSTSLYYYDNEGCHENDWLFLTVMNSYGDWTITPHATNKNYAFIIYRDGYIYPDGYISSKSHSTRPVFYLSTDTTYSYAGDGSKANPYRYHNIPVNNITFSIYSTTYGTDTYTDTYTVPEGTTWNDWLNSSELIGTSFVNKVIIRVDQYLNTNKKVIVATGTDGYLLNVDDLSSQIQSQTYSATQTVEWTSGK